MLAARVAGGYRALAKGVVMAAIPTALAFVCPFIWAFIVYQILRSAETNQRTLRELMHSHSGFVTVDDDCVQVFTETRALVPREEVVDGWIEQAGADAYSHIRLTRRRRLLIRPEQAGDALAILDALGIGPDKQTVRFPITSSAVETGQGAIYHLLGPWLGIPMLVSAIGGMVAMLALGSMLVKALAFAVPVLALAMTRGFVRTVQRRQVIVGRDGFTIMDGTTARFVGFQGVETIEHLPMQGHNIAGAPRDTVVVKLADNTRLELCCGSFVADDQEMLAALYQRLLDTHAAYRTAQLREEGGLTLLDRGGRSLEDWRSELERLVKEGTDYRASRLNAVHLAEVVEDATSTVERRLGAAIALSSLEKQPALQQRVRIAAQACANQKLRIALDHAYEGTVELAELEAALEDMREKANA